MAQYFEDNKITYQQLVMGQIKIIQSITSKELRDSTKSIKNLIGEQTVEAEDTRHTYLQAVEMLGSLLSPYFNSTDIKDAFEAFCILYDMELVTALEDDDFIQQLEIDFNDEDIENTVTKDGDVKNQVNLYFLNFKIKNARLMFRMLMKLFKDREFLSEGTYGDSEKDDGDSNMDAVDEEQE